MIIHTALLYSLLSFIEASGNVTYSLIILCDKINIFNIYPTSWYIFLINTIEYTSFESYIFTFYNRATIQILDATSSDKSLL